ncbi:uncharacterized protein OCT59_017779 [Rhizophagus irregularis]|uniref:Uncharacterized protein n=2 Tax=Rhizophagus irregularis TaxID=588596 RepID=A0A015KIW9_RHIIW|nr:hypothetical protein RirG_187700 [Rhizophagus irregularis DAOM 197198w]UZO25514.1 hypothetical protein OCT59_017779 [Rhizophagus irregularis]GET66159.1 hypothetical protein RIR_jg20812.t1 [Rhizophagus irregularis DAOM 181602=DAOM 197198]CAB5201482.1 unnamed protein product [Rhizophagus irregularis]CAG8753581.1 3626_t:CDS:1 [Rhizophagus irregularis]
MFSSSSNNTNTIAPVNDDATTAIEIFINSGIKESYIIAPPAESLASSSIAESSHRPSKSRSNNTVVNPDPDSYLDELCLIPEQSPSSIRATQVTYQEKRQAEAQAVATFHGTSAKRFRQR